MRPCSVLDRRDDPGADTVGIMSMPLSRAMSAATLAYSVFALVKPRHIGDNMTSDPVQQPHYDVVAYVFGGRDLAISSIGVFARSPQAVRAAMLARIACDVADAAVLGPRADADSRAKIMGAALGWGVLNVAALAIDTRREGTRGALV